MRILLNLKGHSSLTGAGTYEEVLVRELGKRHDVKIFDDEKDLDGDWDVFHCSDLKHLSSSVVRKVKCPVVANVHDYYWVNYYHFLCLDAPLRLLFQKYRKRKYQALFKHIDSLIVHSQFMYDIIDHPNKQLNFHYGLDFDKIESKAWQEREDLILFVGGDYFRKGLPRLLRAMPKILQEVPTAKLLVIGKDYWYARDFASFLARGLPVEIVNGMPRDEVCKIYARGKALVLPSEIEALSIVSAEGTFAGLPPILANIGGMPEVVRNGETGFLFDLPDTDMLASQIVRCLTDRKMSEQMVLKGKAFFSQFNSQQMMARHEEIYQDVIQKAQDRECGTSMKLFVSRRRKV